MKQSAVNPWKWQDAFGYSQAIDLSGAQRLLICSGQTSIGSDGAVQHAGDMKAQVAAALDNLETVLEAAGLGFRNVVRLNVYTTDVDRMTENWETFVGRLGEAGCRPACTVLGVARLAFPDLLVELEATAAA